MRRALIIAVTACAAYAAPVLADITIGRDILRSGDVSPSSALFKLLLESEDARDQLKIQNEKRAGLKNTAFKRVIVNVAVKDVVKGQGNNPLNQQQPLNNTTLANGQIVFLATDDVDQGNNNNGGGGGQDPANLAACVGLNVTAAPSPTAAATTLFVSIRVDPATLNCTAAGGQSADGDFLIFQMSTTGGLVSFLSIFADALQPDWIIISPPGGIFGPTGVGVQTFIFDVRAADNSVTIRATVQVNKAGLNTSSVTILNMEAI